MATSFWSSSVGTKSTSRPWQATATPLAWCCMYCVRRACRLTYHRSSAASVNRLGIYYCRHGFLWTIDTHCLLERPQFEELEKLFREFAKSKHDPNRSAKTC